jgi:hypothetical protein
MPSELERYISDNALQVSLTAIRQFKISFTRSKFFGLSDKSIVDFVIASGSCVFTIGQSQPHNLP